VLKWLPAVLIGNRSHGSIMAKHQESNRMSFLKGALFGSAVGATALATYQYLGRILKQPRLISRAVISNIDDFASEEARALFIAAENLRSGIDVRHLENGEHRRILHAGYRNFRESWARDFGFASYGLLALEEYEVVKDTLAAFFLYQSSDGSLPVKLQSLSVLSRFLHSFLEREQSTHPILTPKYITGHGTPSLDGQALLIIASANYLEASGDDEFVHLYWDVLRRAIRWLENFNIRGQGELLYQQAYADWADSIDRRGHGLYTNVVYWKALKCMAQMAGALGYPEDSDHYNQLAERVALSINTLLWRPELGYFASTGRQDQLSSAGNLLAAAWKLARPDQADSILEAIQKSGMAEPVPTRVAFPAYSQNNIAIENRLGGMAKYHTEAAWLWIGAWHVIALVEHERMEEAQAILAAIAHVIVRDQQVHEVYGPDGKPLSSLWYQSEAPLTWNAGMVVYAYHSFEAHINEEIDLKKIAEQMIR
jgi:glycogen debranching enzyme